MRGQLSTQESHNAHLREQLEGAEALRKEQIAKLEAELARAEHHTQETREAAAVVREDGAKLRTQLESLEEQNRAVALSTGTNGEQECRAAEEARSRSGSCQGPGRRGARGGGGIARDSWRRWSRRTRRCWPRLVPRPKPDPR